VRVYRLLTYFNFDNDRKFKGECTMSKKSFFVVVLLLLAAFALTACQGAVGPQGPEGPQGPQGEQGPAGEPGADGASVSMADLTCTECHNDTTIITGKKVSWETSLHSVGTSAAYAGGRDGCAACHSGGTFKAMIAEGANPGNYEGDVMEVTHQDCRTCHQVHVTYTGDDWALTTDADVMLYAFEDVTYEGGTGNLCGTCHQPRRAIAEADADGNIEVTSTHWGPHHGPQTAMLMGIGGGGVEGSASGHYSLVEDTCVACHVGENDNHNFVPGLASCQGCHEGAESFDLNGLQTEVEAQLGELAEKLVAAGLWDEAEDHPVVGVYPAAQAQALWNYIYIAHEDASRGVHNPAYTKALLEASLAAFE
jgi:hypothetical protein